MKKVILFIIVAGVAMVASAGLVSWQNTNISGDALAASWMDGWAVELFQDVDDNNTAGWQNGLVIDNLGAGGTLQINAASANGTVNDSFLGLFTTSKNVTNLLFGIHTVGSQDTPDDIKLYTVVYDNANKDLATYFVVLDAGTFSSGSVVAPGTPTIYDATPGGSVAGAWQQVVPEPVSMALLACGTAVCLMVVRVKRRMSIS